MSGWPRVLTVLTIVVFFVVIFFGLGLSGTLGRKLDADRPEQCEALATAQDPQASILEPQNTWSNFAYLIAGMLVMYRSRNLLGAAVGLNLALEFLFSGLYHARLTETTQMIDVAWIYVLLLSLFVYGIQCIFYQPFALVRDFVLQTSRLTFSIPLLITSLITVAVIGTGLLMGEYKDDVFESTKTTIALVVLVAIPLIIGLIAAGIRGASWIHILMPIFVIFSVGIPTLLFKFSDGREHKFFNWCCPDAVLQSHAAWHILSAVMVLVAYDIFAQLSGDGRIFSLTNEAPQDLATVAA